MPVIDPLYSSSTPVTPPRAASPRWLRFGLVAVVLLPALPLFDLVAGFGYDWTNHEWMIAWLGEYFRQHHAMPSVFNSAVAVGMPQPVFYAFLLYPALGVLSSLVGAALAVRIAVVFTLALQAGAVFRAARTTGGERTIALVLAFAVTASTYSLTNLYHRGALTEFFAVAFFVPALAWAVVALAEDAPRFAWLSAVMFALTVGTHPPTALLATLFAALLIAAALAGGLGSGRVRWTFVAGGGLVGCVAAPWVYANAALRSDIGIVGRYRDLDLMAARTDSLLGRFAPFPSEAFWPPRHNELPFVEAPLDGACWVLLAWFLFVAWRGGSKPEKDGPRRGAGWGWLCAAGLIWAAVMTFVSVSRTGANWARPLAPYVQFVYRFVGHANAALLVAVFAAAALAVRRGGALMHSRASRVVSGVAAAIALVSVGIKLQHATATLEHRADPQYAWHGDRSALVSEPRADAVADYAAVRRTPQFAPKAERAAAHVAFGVGRAGGTFGVVEPTRLSLREAGWVVTNVVAFPWNELLVDGHPVAPGLVARWRMAVKLPVGEHTLSWNWRPPPLWVQLLGVSRVGFALALAGAAIAFWPRRRTG
jgi:hypothetical protein